MKRLFTTAAILIALAAPAMALDAGRASYLDTGKSIHFNTPRPLTVGCTQTNDAVQVVKFVQRRDWNGLEEFVEWINNGNSETRLCIALNQSSDNSWKIVKSTPLDKNRGRWACLQVQYDFRPEADQTTPLPCWWLYVW